MRNDKYCKWEWNGEDFDYYDTECGETFYIESGTLKENKIKYCPFCGKEIEELNNGLK